MAAPITTFPKKNQNECRQDAPQVYHLLFLTSPHYLPFKPLHFPSVLSLSHLRPRRSPYDSVRSISTAVMATSRLRNLVPANTVAFEDASGGGASNGSVSSTAATTALDDEEDATLAVRYRLPPQEIKDIVDAPPLPALSFSPHRDKILFLKRRALPPLTELARPEERLAGVRIDGKCNTRTRMSFYSGIGIYQLLPDGTLGPEIEVRGFPAGAKINFVTWSPDGRHLAFTIRFDEGESSTSKLRVWVAQVETGIAL